MDFGNRSSNPVILLLLCGLLIGGMAVLVSGASGETSISDTSAELGINSTGLGGSASGEEPEITIETPVTETDDHVMVTVDLDGAPEGELWVFTYPGPKQGDYEEVITESGTLQVPTDDLSPFEDDAELVAEIETDVGFDEDSTYVEPADINPAISFVEPVTETDDYVTVDIDLDGADYVELIVDNFDSGESYENFDVTQSGDYDVPADELDLSGGDELWVEVWHPDYGWDDDDTFVEEADINPSISFIEPVIETDEYVTVDIDLDGADYVELYVENFGSGEWYDNLEVTQSGDYDVPAGELDLSGGDELEADVWHPDYDEDWDDTIVEQADINPTISFVEPVTETDEYVTVDIDLDGADYVELYVENFDSGEWYENFDVTQSGHYDVPASELDLSSGDELDADVYHSEYGGDWDNTIVGHADSNPSISFIEPVTETDDYVTVDIDLDGADYVELIVENFDSGDWYENFEVTQSGNYDVPSDELDLSGGDELEANVWHPDYDGDWANTFVEQADNNPIISFVEPVMETDEYVTVDIDLRGGSWGELDIENHGNDNYYWNEELDGSGEYDVPADELEIAAGHELWAEVHTDEDWNEDSTVVQAEAAPAVFEIEETDYPDSITEGDLQTANVTITNTGEMTGQQEISLHVVDIGLVDYVTVELASGESTHVELSWETSGHDLGSYELEVVTEDDSGWGEFEIVAPSPDAPLFAVSINQAPDTVDPNTEVLTIEAGVQNRGGLEGTQDIRFSVDGDVMEETELALESDSTWHPLEFDWQTADLEAGTYEIAIESADRSTTTSIEILEPAEPAAFDVEIVETNALLEAGETVEAAIEVSNRGDETGEQTVALEGGGAVRDEVTLELGGGDSTTETLTWQTTDNDVGEHTVVASSPDSADEAVVTVGDVDFQVSIDDVTYDPDDGTVRVQATVQNEGTLDGNQEVSIDHDGQMRDSQPIQLASGDSRSVLFSWQVDESPEELNVELASENDADSARQSVVIEEDDDQQAEEEESGTSWPIDPGYVIVLILGVSIGAYLHWRRAPGMELQSSLGQETDDSDGQSDGESAGESGG